MFKINPMYHIIDGKYIARSEFEQYVKRIHSNENFKDKMLFDKN